VSGCGMEWMGLGRGSFFRLYELGNQPSVYIKDRKFFDELRILCSMEFIIVIKVKHIHRSKEVETKCFYNTILVIGR